MTHTWCSSSPALKRSVSTAGTHSAGRPVPANQEGPNGPLSWIAVIAASDNARSVREAAGDIELAIDLL